MNYPVLGENMSKEDVKSFLSYFKSLTNLSLQVLPLYRRYGDKHVLLIRVGSFYEMYGPQAHEWSVKLGIKLTSKGNCGFPDSVLPDYIHKLVHEHGQRVAVFEQVRGGETTAQLRTAVLLRDASRPGARITKSGTLTVAGGKSYGMARYLDRIYTPGTLLKAEDEPVYLAALYRDSTNANDPITSDTVFHLTFCDLASPETIAAIYRMLLQLHALRRALEPLPSLYSRAAALDDGLAGLLKQLDKAFDFSPNATGSALTIRPGFDEKYDKYVSVEGQLQDRAAQIELNFRTHFNFGRSEKTPEFRPAVLSTTFPDATPTPGYIELTPAEYAKVVFNDVRLDENEKSLCIISGPNMGGKSSYLRILGVAALMAQLGCPVPASSATLPIFDAILTRFGSSDDVYHDQSTFMMELTELQEILSKATRNSLVLLDELGRGTAHDDGTALFCAVVREMLQRRTLTLMTTHYHGVDDILRKALAPDEFARIQFLQSQCTTDRSGLKVDYKLVPGMAQSSRGLEIAAWANLPKHILSDAMRIRDRYVRSQTQSL
ncbi:MutS protein 1 [Blastocladiella emersonii ATCC 22665]|nr:MutS protein 1 [Blastocladiella emersonii ATCC 22665]